MKCPILQLEAVDSTNSYVKSRWRDLADGTLVCAREQTAGRGRRDRRWIAPAGVNFTGTLMVKRPGIPFHAGCVLGLGALAALRELAPEADFYLKWPNDVYVGDAKIAGILCESCGMENGRIAAVAAGLGVNVNMDAAAVAAVRDSRATSLAVLAGRSFNLEKVAEKLAKTLFLYYSIYSKETDELVRLWRAENRLLGERIGVITDGGDRFCGTFSAIASDGSLELVEDSGRMRSFCCADVHVDRSSIDFEKLKRKRST